MLIGYDRRFLSNRAGEAAAEVFAGNNIPVTLLSEDAPTPLITYATAIQKAAYGLAFTASHNPPEWNGLKVFHGDGSLLLDDETQQIQAETNRLALEEVIKIDLDIALESGIVQRRDFTNEYVDAVEALIDLDAIRQAGLKVIVDPMYGVGQLTLGTILTEARCRVTFIHERHNPLVRRPLARAEPGGAAAAGDARGGRPLRPGPGHRRRRRPHRHRGRARRIHHDQRHPAAALLVSARGPRRDAAAWCATWPPRTCWTGWRRISARSASRCRSASSTSPARWSPTMRCWAASRAAGLTIRGHILGKDGIFASALVVEMLARTREKISQLRQRVYDITGRLYSLEDSIPSTPEMRVAVPRRLAQTPPEQIGALPGRQGLPRRWDEVLPGQRQLGAGALLRHRADPAPVRRGRFARKGQRADPAPPGIRDQVRWAVAILDRWTWRDDYSGS